MTKLELDFQCYIMIMKLQLPKEELRELQNDRRMN